MFGITIGVKEDGPLALLDLLMTRQMVEVENFLLTIQPWKVTPNLGDKLIWKEIKLSYSYSFSCSVYLENIGASKGGIFCSRGFMG